MDVKLSIVPGQITSRRRHALEGPQGVPKTYYALNGVNGADLSSANVHSAY